MKTNDNKKYDVLVGYDEILETEVQGVLKDNHIRPNIVAATYFYIKGVVKATVEKLRKLMAGIHFTFKKNGKEKTYKVVYLSATAHRPSYLEEQKAKKKQKKTATPQPEKSVNKKKPWYFHTKKSVNKKETLVEMAKKTAKKVKVNQHKTNYEKKLDTRVKKAVRYIARIEAKKATAGLKTAKSKGIRKPVQQKFNFKAAA